MKVQEFIELFKEPTNFYILNEQNKLVDKCSIKSKSKYSECEIIMAKQGDMNMYLYVNGD